MKRFTILEMLVVCAVIAVLLSLLLPSLANAREITKQVICLSNQSQISKGAYAYMTSNNYRLPSQQPKELASSTKSYWKLQIAEAMGETGFTNHKDIRLTVNVWECPKFPELFSDMVGIRHAGGIAYNGLGLRTKEVTSGTATCCPKYALNVGQVEFASETLMLSDIYDRPTNGAGWLRISRNAGESSAIHRVGGNNIFIDGSGRWMSYAEREAGKDGDTLYWLKATK